MSDRDLKELLVILGVVFGFTAVLVSVILLIVHAVNGDACREFCEDFGDAPYHSASYGCFCVTPDGQRYNPDMLTKSETAAVLPAEAL